MGPADHAGLALVELDRQPRIGDVDRHSGVLVDPATSVTRTSCSWARVIHKITPAVPTPTTRPALLPRRHL
jgi:hypothetical protein